MVMCRASARVNSQTAGTMQMEQKNTKNAGMYAPNAPTAPPVHPKMSSNAVICSSFGWPDTIHTAPLPRVAPPRNVPMVKRRAQGRQSCGVAAMRA